MGSLVSGITSIFSGNAANKTAKRTAGAMDQGVRDFQEAGQGLQDFYEPFTGQAEPAFQRLADLIMGGDYSQFQESPGYQFAQDESRRAIERSAAARGSVVSGRTLKALDERSQQVANQEYGNYLQQLQSLFGTSFGIGEAQAKTPFDVLGQTVPLTIGAQQTRGQGNEARIAGLGSGIGAIASFATPFLGGGVGSVAGSAPWGTSLSNTGLMNVGGRYY